MENIDIPKRFIYGLGKQLLFILSMFLSLQVSSQTVTITSPVSSTTYCAGTSIAITYTVSSNFSNVGFNNVFTTQLSDATGSFASPVTLGTTTAVTGGSSSFTIPFATSSGVSYRVRILASNPTFTSQSNGVGLTVNALALSTPTIGSTTLCQSEITTVNFTQNCNFAAGNTYSVQLSNATGSFTAPLTIGTRTNTTAAAITVTVPSGISAGSGYRVRIVSSNPSLTSVDNGLNITVNTSVGSPTIVPSGTWNAYAYNGFNNYATNYQGFYTENNLSFDTRTRFVSPLSPSSATVGASLTGLAYTGCPFSSGGTNFSVTYKRTNIPCGFYQIDIAAHDDNAYFYLNRNLIWSHVGWGDVHPNIYTAFISPSDSLEFRYSNGAGGGYYAVNIYTVNPLNFSPPVTICAGSTSTITATNSNTIAVNYAWSPSITATPSVASLTTVVTPTATTIYTLTAIDAGTTTCSYNNTITITVNPLPTTTVASASSLTCYGINTTTLTTGGAASYTWSPSAGLSSVNGFSVVANPTVNTTYTVSGSNNCATLTATTTISVQTQPTSPATSTFGNNTWNVFCYYTPNTYTSTTNITDYYGYYTENNLSFDSRNRWGNLLAPSSATGGTMGIAYQGCTIGIDYHSTISKRTNFTCGYYQIDLSYHDDGVTVFVNGVQVFQHIGCCDVHTNIWSGFLSPTSTVEIRHQEGSGGSGIAANFVIIPYPVLSPPVTICAGTSTSLTASPYIVGANYVWGPASSLTVTTTGTLVPASPTIGTNYTCTITDPVTTCSAAASVSVTVNPLPTTTLSASTNTILCSATIPTLTASGANTYSWAPAAGLNTTSGYSVIATPTITTTYTVTGNNNCSGIDASQLITVVPLVTETFFPTGAWNVYGHNNTTFNNYYGYYTHAGVGATGYDFNTGTQWVSGLAPSTATANVSGTKWLGCVMSATNISLSFKRTGFACNIYSITVLNNDDNAALLINGVQVASRNYTNSSALYWVGPLSANSTVEFRLGQGTGGSGLSVSFTAATATSSLSTWMGGTSNDWFTASNWCGSGVPTSTTNVLIPAAAGLLFYPVINAAGAACRSLTITGTTAGYTFANSGTIAAVPASSLTISGSNSLDVYGDWINNGVFTAGSGTVNILGSTSTSITGISTNTFNNLVINKTGAVTVTIPASSVCQVSKSLTFTNGIINQNGTLQFLNNSTAIGASNSSYVNGQVIKIGNQAFSFPIGVSNFYRPISISSPSLATDNFTAQYFLTDPSPTYTHTSKDLTIDHINRCEYWILNRIGGSSNVFVTMTWNTTSCGVTNLPDLLVARWDAGQAKWKDEGNGGTTGNSTAGTIVSSSLVTTFSPFTLASKTSQNPLPIELVSFGCKNISKNINSLAWSTATESNNDYYAIERSVDGITFEQIARKDGAGNSLTLLNYSYNDQNPYKGISYYRLKQVDFDGKFTYSEICSVINNGDGGVAFYPNPVKNTLTIDYDFYEKSKPNSVTITITDVTGKLVSVSSTFVDSKINLDCSDLAEGIYFLKVLIGSKEVVNKFTVQK